MAKKKRLTKKAKARLKKDAAVSAVLASALLNVYFFSGVYLFSNTNQLDTLAYDVAYSNLCVKNYAENMADRLEVADDPAIAEVKFEAICNRGEFINYYQNAYEAYRVDQIY